MSSKNEKRKVLFERLEVVCNDIIKIKQIIKEYEHIDNYWQTSYRLTIDDLSYSNALINQTEQILIKNTEDLLGARYLLVNAEHVKTIIVQQLKHLK